MTAAQGAPHWADIGESTSVAGVLFLCWVHRWFGRWPFRLCVWPVVACHWLGNRVGRQASMQYLQRLQAHSGVLGHAPKWRDSLRHFFTFADTMLDKILGLGGRYPAERIHLHRDLVLQKIARREGGLILTAHIGCLELCQVLAEQVPGFRITVLVHTAHAQRFNRLLQRLDPLAAVELVQVTEMGPATAVMLAERVAAGGFVAIVGDRTPVQGGRSVTADFLGPPRAVPDRRLCARRRAGLPGLHHGLPAPGRRLSGGIRTVRRTHRAAAWLARRRAGRTGTALRALAGTAGHPVPVGLVQFLPLLGSGSA